MNKELLIGLLALASSFLGCLQVINLARGHLLLTNITSCLIAVSQLTVYRMAPTVDGTLGTLAYVVGGLIGANASLWVKKRIESKGT